MRKHLGKLSIHRSRRRRLSPLALVGITVSTLLILAVTGVAFAMPQVFSSHAADAEHQQQHHQKHKHKQEQDQQQKQQQNQQQDQQQQKKQDQQQQQQQQPQMVNCTLTVPANPLTAQGLATPYKLGGGCDEANKMQAAFVQGAVIDPAGNISVYNPLVVNQDQQSDQQQAAAPVMPNIPAGSTVGIWFGFNGNNLTLRGMKGSLKQGNCVNGTNGSLFGQFSYCNAPAFFQAANAAMAAGKINPNPGNAALGTGKDGLTCPSVRDFSVVDQDQSDNVTTTYLINGTQQANASDNRLLDVALDGALGCTPLTAPDLANPGQMTTALPLNELQAAAQQAAPVALVPLGDPMTLVDNTPDAAKTELYRMGVDQPAVGDSDGGNTVTYCQNLLRIAPQRLVTDAPLT